MIERILPPVFYEAILSELLLRVRWTTHCIKFGEDIGESSELSR